MFSMSLKGGEEDPYNPYRPEVRWPMISSTVPPPAPCPPVPSALGYWLGGMAVGVAITLLLGLLVWWVRSQRNSGRFIILCIVMTFLFLGDQAVLPAKRTRSLASLDSEEGESPNKRARRAVTTPKRRLLRPRR